VTNRTAARLAWSLAAVCVLLVGVGDVFSWRNGESLAGSFGDVAVVAFGVLGALLASRRPANAIGWLFLGGGVLLGLGVSADPLATYGLVNHPGSVPGADFAAWLSKWIWMPGTVLLLVFSPLLFPDGRLPSRRWRPVAWLAASSALVTTAFVAIAGWPLKGRQLIYGNEPPPNPAHWSPGRSLPAREGHHSDRPPTGADPRVRAGPKHARPGMLALRIARHETHPPTEPGRSHADQRR
jgi:hypothetical protein